ncbi:MAG: NAD(P)/FAD-dependent oxidoreductase [Acidobacteria bacterium]|nr:NAD(P)/FAD-dependent oxidoreductase [Acidobacteriota bacterium]
MRDPLFEPIRINSLEVPNRLFMPAVHLNMARQGQVTEQILDFYAERASGGVGLITVGYATVDERAGGPGNIGAHDDAFIPGLRRLAEIIHHHGSLAAVQLNHAGRYNPSLLMEGRPPVAPSPLPSPLTRDTPHELDGDEIHGVIEAFAASAGRVQNAGFDAVEVLAGTGYLISEFLSPVTNHREDEWGGSFENRMHFGLEVVRAVRATVGDGFPLLVRINGNEMIPGGLGPEDLRRFARELESAGADAFNVNAGWHEARVPQIIAEVPRGAFAYLARGIRETVSVPVIASHRINTPRLARELIVSGICDAVAMARALIADPRLPEKARLGHEDQILHCVACAQGCFDALFQGRPVTCLCNPRAGHEAETEILPADRRLDVMVVGGGAAGLSAAAAAAERGHRVTVYEASDHLGGQLLLAGAPPGREEFRELARDLEQQATRAGIRVVLNRRVDAKLVLEEKPDRVLLATGARPTRPSIPGSQQPHVVQAWNVLSGRIPTGRRVVVIGAGAVGIETALYLAERGTLSGEALKFLLLHHADDPERLVEQATHGTVEVTVVEMLDSAGADIGRTTRWAMLADLKRDRVRVLTGAVAREITADTVIVDRNGDRHELVADTVVLAAGAAPYNPLQEALEEHGVKVQVIGDADTLSNAYHAIHQGFNVGRRI